MPQLIVQQIAFKRAFPRSYCGGGGGQKCVHCRLSAASVQWLCFLFLSEMALLMMTPWIQNVAEPRRNDHIEKVLKLRDPHFHAVIAAIWNAISVLEQFWRTATETEIATKTTF